MLFLQGSKLSNPARVWIHLCRNFIINLFINQRNVEKEEDANPDSTESSENYKMFLNPTILIAFIIDSRSYSSFYQKKEWRVTA